MSESEPDAVPLHLTPFNIPELMSIKDTEALSYVNDLLEELTAIDQNLGPDNDVERQNRRPSYEQAVQKSSAVLKPLIPSKTYTDDESSPLGEVTDDDEEDTKVFELYKRFWLKEPPAISIKDYLQRFHRYCRSSPATYLTAGWLVYLVVVQKKLMPLTRRNVFRLFCTAFVVSAKFIEDKLYSMTRYATTAGLKKPDLARLELSFLLFIDFEVRADRETLKKGLRKWAELNQAVHNKCSLESVTLEEEELAA